MCVIPDLNLFKPTVAPTAPQLPVTAPDKGNENAAYPNPSHPGLLPPYIHFSYFVTKRKYQQRTDRGINRLQYIPPPLHRSNRLEQINSPLYEAHCSIKCYS